MPKKPRSNCLYCSKITKRAGYRYCSNQCQSNYQYRSYIKLWQDGEVRGLQRLGVVSRHVKRYLRDKYKNKCCVCGWSEINQFSGVVPLVADHVDGDWRNNHESNLRLICPNCDALTSTYAGLNRGRGRSNRKISKRVEEARVLQQGVI